MRRDPRRRGARRPDARDHIEDLLADRRPQPFPATDEDAAELRAAITLRAAAPGADTPDPDFVAALHRRLAAAAEADARADVEGRADAGTALTGEHARPPASAQANPPETRPAGEAAAGPPRPALGEARRTGGGTRRRFVTVGSIAAAGTAAGVAVGAVVGRATGDDDAPSTTATDDVLMPTTASWWTVATSQDLPEGGVRAFDLGTVSGFVRRTEGQVRAVSGVCTHQGCQLALDAAARRLACPCHRTVFALTGEVVHSQLRTPPRTLPEIQVREVSGKVQVLAPPRPA
ncbi:putative iron sulphur protein (secreted protein) [Frankia canadensis]|uniref:Putative iron sulphur protein (Secreted protein) n=1 Tax=Frankia canadensis TaxID=1836972 RepID=A0A2I2KP08_9ACTN|nr:Rieske (2Fe-2S) protein [Frankia canadensis]SNQ47379.1 putative iron sulphur protein (secreted protein) [Frankia canadensis]SOU54669.1 putative iron sulphur protein (secreted protein) [Frankia canadensis]